MTPQQLVQLCTAIYGETGWSRALSDDIGINQRTTPAPRAGTRSQRALGLIVLASRQGSAVASKAGRLRFS